MIYYDILWYIMVYCDINKILYYIISYYCTILYYFMLFYLFYIILFYFILYYIILYHIIHMYILQYIYIYIAAKKKSFKSVQLPNTACSTSLGRSGLPRQSLDVSNPYCLSILESKPWIMSGKPRSRMVPHRWKLLLSTNPWKKKQNVKLQQPNLKEIYHQQLCFAADEIGNKTLTPSSNELSLFVKSTNIKLFPWCLWRTSHRTWPLGCWDNESTGNLLDINWTLATWVCLKIVYPFLPNG